MSEATAARIRALNDAFRCTTDVIGMRIANNELVATCGITARGNDFLLAAIRAVAQFDGFTPENDPWHEHDFGEVEVDGVRVWFKIDYYDQALAYGSEDPSDPLRTTRVLTIMLPEEY